MSTALELAKMGATQELASLLIARPDGATTRDENGVSILMVALYHGHLETVSLLRQWIDRLDIHQASALNEPEAIRFWADADPTVVNRLSPDGFTPLCLAAYFGAPEALDVLLELQADPNQHSENPLGVAAVHAALANGHVSLARTLAEHGSDLNAVTAAGWSVLHYCADLGDVALTEFLVAKGAKHGAKSDSGLTAIELAHEVGHIEVAEWLEANASSSG